MTHTSDPMSRTFIDENLLSWEVYASGGKFGLPDDPKVVFHCQSDPAQRARFVRYGEDNAQAEQAVQSLPDEQLRRMLKEAEQLD
jgi:hypothetical protein